MRHDLRQTPPTETQTDSPANPSRPHQPHRPHTRLAGTHAPQPRTHRHALQMGRQQHRNRLRLQRHDSIRLQKRPQRQAAAHRPRHGGGKPQNPRQPPQGRRPRILTPAAHTATHTSDSTSATANSSMPPAAAKPSKPKNSPHRFTPKTTLERIRFLQNEPPAAPESRQNAV